MSSKHLDSPTPEQLARLERQRRAAEEGAQAMKEVAAKAVAIRENMARLRQLRLAREAADLRAKRAKASAGGKA